MNIFSDIQSLMTDPIGMIVIQVWHVPGGEVRWNCGLVQTRRDGDEYFSLPVPAVEFLAAVQQVVAASE